MADMALTTFIHSDGRCDGGWLITSEACPLCGATNNDICGKAVGRSYFAERSKEAILERIREFAPDLLAELERAALRMENAAEVYKDMEPDATQWREWASQIRAAIAKATGAA